jgi:hypothetical protein
MKKAITLLLLFTSSAVAEIKLDGLKELETKSINLATPNAPCELTLPDDNWSFMSKNERPDGTAAYYHYALEGSAINFSVYIDQSNECKAGDECLELALKNPHYKNAQNIIKYKKAGYSVAELVLDFSKTLGREAHQLNIIAEKYENGCWYDVHLSQVAAHSPAPFELISILEQLKTR